MWKKFLVITIMVLLTGAIALSTHVFIIQYFQPTDFKISPYANQMIGYVIRWCTVVGAMIIFICSKKTWENISLFPRVMLFALLIMALVEQLLRTPLMQVIIGYSWTSQAISTLPVYIGFLTLSLLIIFFVPILSRAAHWRFLKYFVFSMLTTALVIAAKKIATSLLSILSPHPQLVDVSKIISLPYGMGVLVPAYITFLEPTVASFIVFYLIEDKLKKFSTLSKGLIMGGLISLIHAGGYSILQIVNSSGNLPYRIFYHGQFLWEYFTLGILTAYSFYLYRKVSAPTRKKSL